MKRKAKQYRVVAEKRLTLPFDVIAIAVIVGLAMVWIAREAGGF